MSPMYRIEHRADEVEAKRQRVREAYAAVGFRSPQYDREFAELHDLNMEVMAEHFRQQRGLPPSARTPYCPA